MKKIKTLIIALFCMIISLPLIFFNFDENAVSEIDNRELTGNPLKVDYSTSETGFWSTITSYVSDRIGFRNEAIRSYTVLNDKVFGVMEHPIYKYGKDGYVFCSGLSVNEHYGQYHEDFADAILEIQTYCEERDVPFVFVFEPAKPAMFQDKLPEGLNYNREWVDEFLAALDKRDINYVDNTKVLAEKIDEGEVVFNQKFDANHWNKLGGFYGVNSILGNLKKEIDTVHINELFEMNISEKTEYSLPVSDFPIEENVPVIKPKFEPDYSMGDKYREEIELTDYYAFGYVNNELRKKENAPKALVFQGSYMNEYGYDFFANSFSEYIYVHDYQNIFNFDYYFNLFKPDCVVFEAAEYTFNETYFSHELMTDMKLNDSLVDVYDKCEELKREEISRDDIKVEIGNQLTKLSCKLNKADQVWFVAGDEFDMRKREDGYEVTVNTKDYEKSKENMKIYTLDGNVLTEHTIK